MSGERDLGTLLRGMTATLQDGTYVFVTRTGRGVPPGLLPRMMFEEAEGTTFILLREEAEAIGWAYEFPSRMITLNVHSALEAVGFLAKIATALSEHNMGVNPVAGYYHDHLFVPEGRENDALRVLDALAAQS